MVPNQSFFSEVFHSACRIVERDCPDGYAKSYAATGLRLADPEAQRVQMLYILSNISKWRTADADLIRKVFLMLSKVPGSID